ncbi:MAG: hypothetical protein FWF24_03265 [Alphaproteobacteria bacterium]|nr:hypothetical protein [Alphaproteobacteria bacterium]
MTDQLHISTVPLDPAETWMIRRVIASNNIDDIPQLFTPYTCALMLKTIEPPRMPNTMDIQGSLVREKTGIKLNLTIPRYEPLQDISKRITAEVKDQNITSCRSKYAAPDSRLTPPSKATGYIMTTDGRTDFFSIPAGKKQDHEINASIPCGKNAAFVHITSLNDRPFHGYAVLDDNFRTPFLAADTIKICEAGFKDVSMDVRRINTIVDLRLTQRHISARGDKGSIKESLHCTVFVPIKKAKNRYAESYNVFSINPDVTSKTVRGMRVYEPTICMPLHASYLYISHIAQKKDHKKSHILPVGLLVPLITGVKYPRYAIRSQELPLLSEQQKCARASSHARSPLYGSPEPSPAPGG